MEATEKREKRTHHGHAIKRLRQTLGIKQDALAFDLGVSQQCVSAYEHKPVIEDDMLERFANALNISTDLIKELEEDPLTVIIENNTFEEGSIANVVGDKTDIENNTFNEGSIANVVGDITNNYNNPIDRIIELSNEKTALFERMLALEKEKNVLLERLLKEKKE